MADYRAFGATNEPDTCLWCGRKLRHEQKWAEDPETRRFVPVFGEDGEPAKQELGGSYHDGYFCGLRCGYQFGVRFGQLGKRLQ